MPTKHLMKKAYLAIFFALNLIGCATGLTLPPEIKHPEYPALEGDLKIRFLAFVEGDPGVPTDEVVVSASGGRSKIDFELSTPFGLGDTTDGLTITVFLGQDNQDLRQIQLNLANIRGSEPCKVGFASEGGRPSGRTIYNGAEGIVTRVPQSFLQYWVTYANKIKPGCAITIKDLFIDGIVLHHTDVGRHILTLDAAAIGLGQGVFPGSSLEVEDRVPEDAGDEVAQVRNILRRARQAAVTLPDDIGKILMLRGIGKAQVKAGDTEGAFQTAALLRDGTIYKVNALKEIAVAQAKAGDQASATKTFQQALSAAVTLGHGGVQPSELRDIAVAQVEVGDAMGALATAAAIEHESDRASVLHAIVDAQAKMGDIKEALSTAAIIRDDIWKAYALKDVAIAQAKAGDIKGALHTARTIGRDSFKAEALKEIAVAQAKAGDRTAATQTFQQALRIVAILRDESLKEEALRIYPSHESNAGIHMQGYPLKANALKEIAVARAKTGDVKGALQTAVTIQNVGVRADTLYQIAVIQAEAGDTEGALRTAATIQRDPPKSWALRIIAIAQAKAGDIKGALKTAATIQSNIYKASAFYKASALMEIAVAQVKAGDQDEAAATFQEALRIAATIQDNRRKTDALQRIAVAQAKVGDVKGSLETAAMIRIDSSKASTLQEIAVSRVKAGDVKGAFQIAAIIQDESYKANALHDIAIAQAEAGDVRSALQTAGAIQNSSTKGYALRRIAAAQAKAGDVKEALSWSANLESPLHKSHALLGVAEGILTRWDAEKPGARVPRR